MTNTLPWNKGVAVGQKSPLQPHQVWRIRGRLETRGKVRDLALFSFALDSMLRSSDILRLRVGDVCGSHLKPKTRPTIQQKKTGKPVSIELNDYTRGALSALVRTRACTQLTDVSWYDDGSCHANLENADGLKPQPRQYIDISEAPDRVRDNYHRILPPLSGRVRVSAGRR